MILAPGSLSADPTTLLCCPDFCPASVLAMLPRQPRAMPRAIIPPPMGIGLPGSWVRCVVVQL